MNCELACVALEFSHPEINEIMSYKDEPSTGSAVRLDFRYMTEVLGRIHICICEECISGSMRYITSSYMATAFGSRPPWSSLHGPSEDSTASLNTRVLRPKTE